MILPIYSIHHPILKQKSIEVTEFNIELREFANNMIETVQYCNGVGLAANQVGSNLSVIVAKDNDNWIVLINPKIIQSSKEYIISNEGCLSCPAVYDTVRRSAIIKVEYCGINGKKYIEEFSNFVSCIIQHEIDHLNGINFLDKVPMQNRIKHNPMLRKIKSGNIQIRYNFVLENNEILERNC